MNELSRRGCRAKEMGFLLDNFHRVGILVDNERVELREER